MSGHIDDALVPAIGHSNGGLETARQHSYAVDSTLVALESIPSSRTLTRDKRMAGPRRSKPHYRKYDLVWASSQG